MTTPPTPKTLPDSREAFEAWYGPRYGTRFLERAATGCYSWDGPNTAWIVWQAALAAQPLVEVQEPVAAWLSESLGDAISAKKKSDMEQHNGMPGKKIAALYEVPLYRAAPVRGLPLTDVALAAETFLLCLDGYTHACHVDGETPGGADELVDSAEASMKGARYTLVGEIFAARQRAAK